MAVPEAGTTVSVSLPFGVPDREMPNVYTLPLMEILDGVALDKVAVPPLIMFRLPPRLLMMLLETVMLESQMPRP